jgi:hypothetical protein
MIEVMAEREQTTNLREFMRRESEIPQHLNLKEYMKKDVNEAP